jgi:hypothetical protein
MVTKLAALPCAWGAGDQDGGLLAPQLQGTVPELLAWSPFAFEGPGRNFGISRTHSPPTRGSCERARPQACELCNLKYLAICGYKEVKSIPLPCCPRGVRIQAAHFHGSLPQSAAEFPAWANQELRNGAASRYDAE